MPRFISSGEHIWIFPGIGPYLNLLPLVTLGLYLWQQHTFMPPPTNEQAAMQQKMMKYMMFVMVLFFYKVPSGLCLYFIASSLWGIGERKLFPPPTAESMGLGASPTPPSGKPGSAADDRRAAKAAANAGKAKRRK
jgi:YidC/Oxa1 family membrane protein insertase